MESDILRMSYFFERKHSVLLVQNYINKVLEREKKAFSTLSSGNCPYPWKGLRTKSLRCLPTQTVLLSYESIFSGMVKAWLYPSVSMATSTVWAELGQSELGVRDGQGAETHMLCRSLHMLCRSLQIYYQYSTVSQVFREPFKYGTNLYWETKINICMISSFSNLFLLIWIILEERKWL